MSILNLIFAGYTGRKNQVWNRQNIKFKNHVHESILWNTDFKNQVQIDKRPDRPCPSRLCPGRMLQIAGAKGAENYSDEP